MLLIRPFQPADAAACYRVFFNAVRLGTASHYSEAQRAAWAPSPDMRDSWPAKLADHITYVAYLSDIVGFMTLGMDGYLDLAYIAPDHMGQGVGRALYSAILADPRSPRTRLTTEASHLARPFFLSLGWQVEAEQTIKRRDVALTNFRMFKDPETTP